MCPDRRPAFRSCREGVCVCVPTGDLLSGLVGRVCVYVSRPGDMLSGLVGRVCVFVPTGDLLSGTYMHVCL